MDAAGWLTQGRTTIPITGSFLFGPDHGDRTRPRAILDSRLIPAASGPRMPPPPPFHTRVGLTGAVGRGKLCLTGPMRSDDRYPGVRFEAPLSFPFTTRDLPASASFRCRTARIRSRSWSLAFCKSPEHTGFLRCAHLALLQAAFLAFQSPARLVTIRPSLHPLLLRVSLFGPFAGMISIPATSWWISAGLRRPLCGATSKTGSCP